MNFRKTTIVALMAFGLTACADKGVIPGSAGLPGTGASPSTENKLAAALDVLKAATVSDDELKAVSLQLRAAEDKELKPAPANNKYAQRLARLTKRHTNEDGLDLNFKVYLDPAINANATPDGSVRVYSGLMDKMNDAELLGVIGHEIGHVKLGHAAARLRSSYMASAGRKAAASSGGAGGALAASELGGLGEAVFKAQFSQSQESDADDYGLAFMKKHKYNPKAMESAFRKLAAFSKGKTGALDQMFATHPDSAARADRMRGKIAGN